MAKEIQSPNPFLEDDEVDDNEFLNHPRQGMSGYMLANERQREEMESKQLQLLQERRRIEERTLQSSYNSLGLVHESEQVGILTAEELLVQREKLQNIEENLDTINSTMKISQKHLNSMKSLFSGIKNYFGRGNSTEGVPRPPGEKPPREDTSPLSKTLGDIRGMSPEGPHPGFRARNLPYDDDDDLDGERLPKKAASPTALSSDVDQKLEQNLDVLCSGLGRLKNLAVGLHDEIEQQNELVDVIHNKADRADETLEHQNRQIRRILKK